MANKMTRCVRDTYVQILNKCIEFNVQLTNLELKMIKNTLRFIFICGGVKKVEKFKDEFIKRLTKEED